MMVASVLDWAKPPSFKRPYLSCIATLEKAPIRGNVFLIDGIMTRENRRILVLFLF